MKVAAMKAAKPALQPTMQPCSVADSLRADLSLCVHWKWK